MSWLHLQLEGVRDLSGPCLSSSSTAESGLAARPRLRDLFLFSPVLSTFPVKPTPRSVRALWVTGFPEMLFLPASTEAAVPPPQHGWGLSVPLSP